MSLAKARCKLKIRSLLCTCLLPVLVSCSQSTETFEPVPWSFSYNFDSAIQISDIFPSDLSAWTKVQCVEPDGTQVSTPQGLSISSGNNIISLDTAHVVSTANAIKFTAPPTGAFVSKSALAKQGIDFQPGDKVTVEFQIYFAGSASGTNAFLMDLESMELNGYPGRRLALSSSEELMLESKNALQAYGSGPNYYQPSGSRVALPRDQWVQIKVELYLSRNNDGSVKIWQNGSLILSATGQNFPSEKDITRYNWAEFGLTANSSSSTQTVWIDDITMSKNL